MGPQIKYGLASSILHLPPYRWEERVAHERAMELLSIFHMEDMANAQAGSLPYGAQRRLEILRALATNPSLLLLDEPAAGMNPSETAELTDNILAIRDTFKIAVLLIEHDMNLVMNICEGIAVLNFGKLIAKGSAGGHPEQSRGHRSLPRPEEGGVNMGVMLKVNDLHVYYGSIHAVKGVSFEVNEGEVVTLIGANGAGKSTVLNTVSGLLHPRAGSIEFEGTDLKGVPPHKILSRGLAQVPEGRHVFLQMTVEENLEMGAYTQPKSGIADGIADVYRRFPRLEERRKQTAGTLSGGEQQMLAMGRALMSKPKLLMLDEPSMGLAPILVEQIFDIIRELHAAGTTILLVEQNANAALSVANRAYVLETGRIVLSGTGDELMHSEQVQKAYLGG